MDILSKQIHDYVPACLQEENDRLLMMSLVKNGTGLPLTENALPMHFTASSWIVSPDKKQVLLVYHSLYNTWSWSSGHADGNADLHAVAQKHAQEETGIPLLLSPLGDRPFSLDVLAVCGYDTEGGGYIPSHLHCNLTYLLIADPAQKTAAPAKNSAVGWFDTQEALAVPSDVWMAEYVYRKLSEKVRMI